MFTKSRNYATGNRILPPKEVAGSIISKRTLADGEHPQACECFPENRLDSQSLRLVAPLVVGEIQLREGNTRGATCHDVIVFASRRQRARHGCDPLPTTSQRTAVQKDSRRFTSSRSFVCACVWLRVVPVDLSRCRTKHFSSTLTNVATSRERSCQKALLSIRLRVRLVALDEWKLSTPGCADGATNPNPLEARCLRILVCKNVHLDWKSLRFTE